MSDSVVAMFLRQAEKARDGGAPAKPQPKARMKAKAKKAPEIISAVPVCAKHGIAKFFYRGPNKQEWRCKQCRAEYGHAWYLKQKRKERREAAKADEANGRDSARAFVRAAVIKPSYAALIHDPKREHVVAILRSLVAILGGAS